MVEMMVAVATVDAVVAAEVMVKMMAAASMVGAVKVEVMVVVA